MLNAINYERERVPGDDVVGGGFGTGSGVPVAELRSARSLLETYLPATGASLWRSEDWFGRGIG